VLVDDVAVIEMLELDEDDEVEDVVDNVVEGCEVKEEEGPLIVKVLLVLDMVKLDEELLVPPGLNGAAHVLDKSAVFLNVSASAVELLPLVTSNVVVVY